MEAGADVWIKTKNAPTLLKDAKNWMSASVMTFNEQSSVLSVRYSNGIVEEIELPDSEEGRMDVVRPRGDELVGDDVTQIEDLTQLVHLHEPGILSALEKRFNRQKIYTRTGPILLAINPYERIGKKYDQHKLSKYIQYYKRQRKNSGGGSADSSTSEKLSPHIFAVAAEAHNAMLSASSSSSWQNDSDALVSQSILISGESGSGKTESSKYLMQYLAQVGSTTSTDSTLGIATKVLETNPLLESFGNARTLRNDNSSRFGKFIKLMFDKTGLLAGASVQTYLLEKVRLVSQSKDERNYHIFYEMCSGATAAQRKEWKLLPVFEFAFLNQSGCFKRKDGVDDAEHFSRTVKAMSTIGFTNDEESSIFKILSGILHVGNFGFKATEGDEARTEITKEDGSKSRLAASELLQVNDFDLEEKLCVRQIRAGVEHVSVHLSPEQCRNARDALCKALYARVFDWLVELINAFLRTKNQRRSTDERFIGILDIFGFEIFPQNSFEQLCINFANETLQQQFNEFVFKVEQKEYEAENVNWTYIEFPDNQDVLDLISQRHIGVLSLIDEECLIPKSSDASFARKLYSKWEGHVRFDASRVQQASGAFVIQHYAGPVTYTSTGFLDKNKDQVHQEAIDLLQSSENEFIRTLCDCSSFRNRDAGNTHNRQSKNRQSRAGGKVSSSSIVSASVGSQFKLQLVELLATVRQTSPHYVRCFKPNDFAKAKEFSRERVTQQLQCSGVIEAVRVARAGFPVRMPHTSFIYRFGLLAASAKANVLPSEAVRKRRGSKCTDAEACAVTQLLSTLCQSLPKCTTTTDHDNGNLFDNQCAAVGIQKGLTKVFLRRSAFNALEHLRSECIITYYEKIQANVLGWYKRSKYVKLRNGMRVIQCKFRLQQKRQRRKKQLYSSVKIQAMVRCYLQRKRYKKKVAARRKRLREEQELLARQKKKAEERKKAEEKKKKQAAAAALAAEQAVVAEKEEKARKGSGTLSQIPKVLSFNKDDGVVLDEDNDNTRPSAHSDASSGFSSPRYHHSNNTIKGTQSLRATVSGVKEPKNDSSDDAHLMPMTMSMLSEPIRASRVVTLPKLSTVQTTKWVNDEDRFSCHICNKRFSVFRRKHHCRSCGEIICGTCSLYHKIEKDSKRVCVSCVAFHASSSSSPSSSAKGPTGLSKSSTGTATADDVEWLNPWPEPPIPENELERLQTLRRLDMDALFSEGVFNMFCDVAARTLKCPIAAVSIIEQDEQILLANMGMSQEVLPRELSLDAHTICESSPLVVLDTKADPRFRDNPMVKGAVKIRFYAGASVLAPNGHALGTICVYDTKPRSRVDPEHVAVLQNLCALAAEKMSRTFTEEVKSS